MWDKFYTALQLASPYWFALLGVVVVWRAFQWLRADASLRRKVLRQLPDAGYIGTLYVLAGESGDMEPGDEFNLPAEGVLGSATGCDVCLPHPTVAARQALFQYEPDGLHLRAYRDEIIAVDGELVPSGAEAILLHGARLELGAVMLQLRLFAGLDVTQELTADGEALYPPKAAQQRRRKSAPPPVSKRRVSDQTHATAPVAGPGSTRRQPPVREAARTQRMQPLPDDDDPQGDDLPFDETEAIDTPTPSRKKQPRKQTRKR